MVITDTGGGKEVIEDGKSGFVVPARDPEAIAERIGRLYADEELGKRMAAAGRERLSTDFSSARTVEQMIAYFESLLADRRA